MTINNNIKEIDLLEYKKSIESLANKKDSMVFLNSGKEHAAIVMGNIFKHSKKNVRIFAGNMNGDVSNDSYYQKYLSSFLKSGGSLKILLQEYDEDKCPDIFNLFNSVDFFYPENVEIKLSNSSVTDDNEKPVHFTIGDDSMYRLENDTTNYFASGSFNDPKNAKHLISLFDSIYDASSKKIM